MISGPLSTPTCPVCHHRVTVLLPFFSDAERNAADLDAATMCLQLRESICWYNRRFSVDTSKS
jgi:hypothetical protein